MQSILNYKFYNTEVEKFGKIHCVIYMMYLLTLCGSMTFFPTTNPGFSPYVVLAWSIYYTYEETK